MTMGVKFAAIVLRSSPERVARVTDLQSKIPTLVAHDAVEKRTLPPLQELVTQGVVAEGHELLTTGQVACAHSHRSILSASASDDDNTWCIILEDDVDVVDGFEARVTAALSGLPPSADVCYLHLYRESDYEGHEEVAPGACKAQRMFGTWGVAYRPRAAALLAKRLTPLAKAIDNVLADAVEAGDVEAYACVPALVSTRGDVGPFDCHRREIRSTIWFND